MAKIAFLKVLPHAGITPNIKEIHDWLLWRADKEQYNFKSYTEIKPFEEYTPANGNGDNHTLVVWRFHRDDTVPKEEIVKVAGPNGHVLYVWTCPKCKSFCRRVEYLLNPKDNIYFGCECKDSVFFGAMRL